MPVDGFEAVGNRTSMDLVVGSLRSSQRCTPHIRPVSESFHRLRILKPQSKFVAASTLTLGNYISSYIIIQSNDLHLMVFPSPVLIWPPG